MQVVGKASFDSEKLFDNIKTLTNAIIKAKPSGAKGNYLKAVYISSTMGASCRVDLSTLIGA